MSDQKPLLPAIAPASGGALTTATGPQRIATRMAENLLGVARSQERTLSAQRRYRIGDYEFREADHAQIQRWARRLGMEPEAVVKGLAIGHRWRGIEAPFAEFCVEDGAIVSLVWDFALLPLTDWAWGQGLQIAHLGILNAPQGPLPQLPECLHELICSDNQITGITLADVPQLKKLYCSHNLLTELDLTPVPGLQELDCSSNELTTLDLKPVPALQWLFCSNNQLVRAGTYGNQLTELDLTPVPALQMLDCSDNQLTILELTPVPALQSLHCGGNQLTELDLTPVPSLEVLWCESNELTNLDLTPAVALKELNCDANELINLDLRPVPALQRLYCGNAFGRVMTTAQAHQYRHRSGNQLRELDLTPVPRLQKLECRFNELTMLDLTPVPELQYLDCDGTVNITGSHPNLDVRRS